MGWHGGDRSCNSAVCLQCVDTYIFTYRHTHAHIHKHKYTYIYEVLRLLCDWHLGYTTAIFLGWPEWLDQYCVFAKQTVKWSDHQMVVALMVQENPPISLSTTFPKEAWPKSWMVNTKTDQNFGGLTSEFFWNHVPCREFAINRSKPLFWDKPKGGYNLERVCPLHCLDPEQFLSISGSSSTTTLELITMFWTEPLLINWMIIVDYPIDVPWHHGYSVDGSEMGDLVSCHFQWEKSDGPLNFGESTFQSNSYVYCSSKTWATYYSNLSVLEYGNTDIEYPLYPIIFPFLSFIYVILYVDTNIYI